MATKDSTGTSNKHIAISKANAQMVATVAIASFVTIFCLVAAKAEFSQSRYNAKVTAAEQKANHQLQDNLKAYDSLSKSYDAFDAASTNIINGNAAGSGDNDGKNSKIIIDALPDKYDYPALASSLEKILTDQSLKVSSITGVDDQVNQQGNVSSTNPQPVTMPYSFTVTNANYPAVGKLIDAMQRSIRPLQIDSLNLSGGASNMTVVVNGHTYYQPAKDVNITKKVVK